MVKRLTTDSKRKRIVDIAGNIFWENGYEGTSMRDIAHACGFHPSNIYNFFTNKNEILYVVLLHDYELLISAIQRILDNNSISPVQKLRLFIRVHFRIALRRKHSYRLLADTELVHLSSTQLKKIIKLRDTYDNILRKIIQAGKNKGDFDDVDEKIVGIIISSVISRSRIWFSRKGTLSPVELADATYGFILNGLRKRITFPRL